MVSGQKRPWKAMLCTVNTHFERWNWPCGLYLYLSSTGTMAECQSLDTNSVSSPARAHSEHNTSMQHCFARAPHARTVAPRVHMQQRRCAHRMAAFTHTCSRQHVSAMILHAQGTMWGATVSGGCSGGNGAPVPNGSVRTASMQASQKMRKRRGLST